MIDEAIKNKILGYADKISWRETLFHLRDDFPDHLPRPGAIFFKSKIDASEGYIIFLEEQIRTAGAGPAASIIQRILDDEKIKFEKLSRT